MGLVIFLIVLGVFFPKTSDFLTISSKEYILNEFSINELFELDFEIS